MYFLSFKFEKGERDKVEKEMKEILCVFDVDAYPH